MKKLNKKGFTLVELLAVIVILALLMVVATSSIGGAMNNAKKNALKTEAQKMLTSAYQDMKSSYMLSGNLDNVSGELKEVASGVTDKIYLYKDGTKYSAYFTVNAANELVSYCVRDEDNKLSLARVFVASGETKNTISVDNSDKSTTPSVDNDITVVSGTDKMCDYASKAMTKMPTAK